MANKRSGNTFYIDTEYEGADDELALPCRVTSIIVSATTADAEVVLADGALATKLDLRVATDGTTQIFDFSQSPIVFTSSIRPTTLTNAVVTCVLRESKG